MEGPEVDRHAVRGELQEMVDHLRAARVFATLGDWSGLERALAELDDARDRLAALLADDVGAGRGQTG